MTTQVVFTIDKAIKDKAIKQAQNKGVALAYFLKLVTEAFAEGQINIGLVETEEFSAKTAKEIAGAIKDIRTGKNFSPAFHSADQVMDYLRSK